MSKRKSGKDIHGIILLDKRLGVSSNKALQEVRGLLQANKAGHTGSLDPLATGLLPLCFGEATKVSAYMLDDDKRYSVVVQLGVITDTGDTEGKVLETRTVPTYALADIHAAIAQFTGPIAQVPPMYSALKHEGKKLYELARAGITIERQARQITIYALHLSDYRDDCLYLDVRCSKGTYIRSLAEDIGYFLGCGATVKALRRTEVGAYQLAQAYTLEQLRAESPEGLQRCLRPLDEPLVFMPAVHLSSEQAIDMQFGRRIPYAGLELGLVRLYNEKIFLGLGEFLMDGKLAPKRLLSSP